MGTRHLIAVQVDGEYKVAQYGQWDGYLSGQGTDVLNFLIGLNGDYEKFKEQVRQCRFMTSEDINDINSTIIGGMIDGKEWQYVYPQLSRDMGAKILDHIMQKDTDKRLNNKIAFAGDSLFCEWAYVIDLDKNTFEVYEGFNKKPLSENERFYGIETDPDTEEYFQIKLLKEYSLFELPTVEELCTLEDSQEIEI